MTPPKPTDPELGPEELERIVEAVLFAHDGPVTIDLLAEVLQSADASAIKTAVTALAQSYDRSERSFEIVKVAGGFQICTRERWAPWVARFQRGSRRARLSRAAVETLAIIAYRQPITRTAMEEIRGVDSGAVLHTLLERNLITVRGRARGVGRPLLYATTPEFLEYFGLDRLDDLPRLDEIESLLKEREAEDPLVEFEPAPELESAAGVDALVDPGPDPTFDPANDTDAEPEAHAIAEEAGAESQGRDSLA
jgi:segregation and condensation protein B